MTLAVVGLVAALVFYMLGYQFNQRQGTIQQTGLIQYASTPSGATIEVDGKALSIKTPTKSTVVPGNHEFVLWRQGYETWRKSLTIPAGMLTWLNYTRFVPKDRPVQPVTALPSAAGSLATSNGRFMAVLPIASQPTIDFYNLQSDNVKSTKLTLLPTDYTDAGTKGVKHTFELARWDSSGRFMLLKHHYGDQVEWLEVDRDANVLRTNINKSFDIPVSDVRFADSSGNSFYVLTAGDIREINITDGTLSRPIASDVAEMAPYDSDTIAYVSTYDAATHQRSVGIVTNGGKTATVLLRSSSAEKIPIHVAINHYFDKDFVVISDNDKVTVLGGDFPTTNGAASVNSLAPITTFKMSSSVQWLQMSQDGRFVIAQHGNEYVSYDLERKVVSPPAQIAGSSVPTKLHWLDDYYVWSDRSNTLVIREFDGANEHTINTVATGFDATLSPSGKYLYSVGKVGKQYQLQRVKMILN